MVAVFVYASTWWKSMQTGLSSPQRKQWILSFSIFTRALFRCFFARFNLLRRCRCRAYQRRCARRICSLFLYGMVYFSMAIHAERSTSINFWKNVFLRITISCHCSYFNVFWRGIMVEFYTRRTVFTTERTNIVFFNYGEPLFQSLSSRNNPCPNSLRMAAIPWTPIRFLRFFIFVWHSKHRACLFIVVTASWPVDAV